VSKVNSLTEHKKWAQRPDAMAYDCNSSYIGGTGRRIMVQGWPQAKKHETYLKK
jgi:hypothetical protein